MTLLEAVGITAAALWAGMINVVVGSGSLVTFPTLIFFGYPPVVANVSNGIGLVAGGLAGSWGYRRELRATAYFAVRLIGVSVVGAVVGALLLLVLPPEAFEAIVPVLILVALVLVVLGPRFNRWLRRRNDRRAAAALADHPAPPRHPQAAGDTAPGLADPALGDPALGRWAWLALIGGVLFAAVYGGYFGAAQGVLLFGIVSLILPMDAQRLNGLKNLLVTVANLVAAIVFIIVSPDQVDWAVVGLIATGSLIGGLVGARIGRRLSPVMLRSVIVVVGLVALVVLLW